MVTRKGTALLVVYADVDVEHDGRSSTPGTTRSTSLSG